MTRHLYSVPSGPSIRKTSQLTVSLLFASGPDGQPRRRRSPAAYSSNRIRACAIVASRPKAISDSGKRMQRDGSACAVSIDGDAAEDVNGFPSFGVAACESVLNIVSTVAPVIAGNLAAINIVRISALAFPPNNRTMFLNSDENRRQDYGQNRLVHAVIACLSHGVGFLPRQKQATRG